MDSALDGEDEDDCLGGVTLQLELAGLGGGELECHRGAFQFEVVTVQVKLLIGCRDDVAFARRLIETVGVGAVPGSSFFSRPELGRTLLRFAFPKKAETLNEAVARLQRGLAH